jgi:hypothetical protein
MIKYIKNYYHAVKNDIRTWIYPFNDLKYGIGNLIAYFKVIWNDRDWDFIYWLELNRLKLSRMEKMIREKGCHVYNIKDADNIKKAVQAIDRLLADDYHDNAFKDHDAKWGKLNVSWGPDINGLSEMIFDRENITEDNQEQERREFKKCLEHSDYLKKQDLKYLTDIINTYLFTWWD